MVKFLLAIPLAISLAAMGIFIYTDYIYQRPTFSDSKEFSLFGQQAQKLLYFKTLKLDKMTTNLYSTRTRLRYISLEAYLRPFEERQLSKLQRAKPLIYDIILETAGQSEPQKLNTLAGKILFENEIRERINANLTMPLIKRIFFSTFIVQ